MQYLDFATLEALSATDFLAAHPYPWINPQGALQDSAYAALLDSQPELSQFARVFGKQRRYGQQSHDRFALEYTKELDAELSDPWRGFLAELQGDRYRAWLCHMIGVRSLELRFHWHFAPTGCSVSPHCDAARKLGSHIFYFNTEKDWNPAWGGATEILDDGGRFSRRSAPRFEDFEVAAVARSLGNHSLLFSRRGDSWHGVRELSCPEGRLRRVFIVVINRNGRLERLRRSISRRLQQGRRSEDLG